MVKVLAVDIVPADYSITLGESVHFTSTVDGGISPYYHQWCVDGNPVSGAIHPTWAFTPTAAGTYYVYLNVTDGLGTKVKSNITPITVTNVGGHSTAINSLKFAIPWLSMISLLATAVMLKGIIVRKRRS